MEAKPHKRIAVEFAKNRQDVIEFTTFEGEEVIATHEINLSSILDDGDDYRALVFAQILVQQSVAEQVARLAGSMARLAQAIQTTASRPQPSSEDLVKMVGDQMQAIMKTMGMAPPDTPPQ